jgi:hypothetical protein
MLKINSLKVFYFFRPGGPGGVTSRPRPVRCFLGAFERGGNDENGAADAALAIERTLCDRLRRGGGVGVFSGTGSRDRAAGLPPVSLSVRAALGAATTAAGDEAQAVRSKGFTPESLSIRATLDAATTAAGGGAAAAAVVFLISHKYNSLIVTIRK